MNRAVGAVLLGDAEHNTGKDHRSPPPKKYNGEGLAYCLGGDNLASMPVRESQDATTGKRAAKSLGISYFTLLRWVSLGILGKRRVPGARKEGYCFDEADMGRLEMMQILRGLGLPLDTCKDCMDSIREAQDGETEAAYLMLRRNGKKYEVIGCTDGIERARSKTKGHDVAIRIDQG